MTDQEFNDTKVRLKKAIDKWFDPLGLRMWREVTFYYHRDPDSMAKSLGCNVEPGCAAQVNSSWKYIEAAVHFNMQRIFGYEDDADIDYVVRHEFMHLLVNEMREWKGARNPIQHEERVCTNLAQVCEWIWEAARRDMEKPAV